MAADGCLLDGGCLRFDDSQRIAASTTRDAHLTPRRSHSFRRAGHDDGIRLSEEGLFV